MEPKPVIEQHELCEIIVCPNGLNIYKQSPPTRCEICHQADQFDPIMAFCTRCQAYMKSKDRLNSELKELVDKLLQEKTKSLHALSVQTKRDHIAQLYLERSQEYFGVNRDKFRRMVETQPELLNSLIIEEEQKRVAEKNGPIEVHNKRVFGWRALYIGGVVTLIVSFGVMERIGSSGSGILDLLLTLAFCAILIFLVISLVGWEVDGKALFIKKTLNETEYTNAYNAFVAEQGTCPKPWVRIFEPDFRIPFPKAKG